MEQVSHSRITVQEKGKSFTVLNPERKDYERVLVDNCQVKEGPRADWSIRKVGDRSVVVELKGRNVEHAIEQLFATVSHPNCVEHIERKNALLIICAKYPSFDTMVAKAQVRARKIGMSLRVVCRNFECTIDNL